ATITLRTVDLQTSVGEVTQTAGSNITVQSGDSVTLTGGLTGAVQLQVDGQAANLFGDDFSAGPFTLAGGERVFTLVATGANGLQTTETHRIVRDVTPPVITVSSPADGALVGEASVDVSGTLDEAHPQRVTVSGVEASVSGSTFFARGVALAEGPNTLTVVAEDRAGLTAEANRSLTYDATPPELAVTDPTSGTTTPQATYTVRGTALDPHLDRVSVDGRRAALVGDAWSVDVPLADGENSLTVRAFDRVGLSTEASFSIYRDSDAPSVQITVPAEGAALRSEEVEVRGAVEDVEGTSVTVNGRAAFIDQGIFFVTVPLSVGENVLTARATDAQGNEGVHTRTVVRDETPPIFVGAEPAAGALAVPVGATFRLGFSEPMADPVGGALTLRSGSQGVPFSTARDGSDLIITPDAALPPASALTLTLTALLTDVAGNPLSTVPAPLGWTTEETAAPPAPVVSPQPPGFLCAPSVTLLGTATPGAFVEAAGGAGQVRARVGSDGGFVLAVDLVPDRLNRLDVTALENDGDRSAATTLEVVQDCRGPAVADAALDGATLTLTFT
ncbi:MAG: Ig-like domain-containing protein, partial [Acidobacteriota bacterium]